jgi:hypothetical protein
MRIAEFGMRNVKLKPQQHAKRHAYGRQAQSIAHSVKFKTESSKQDKSLGYSFRIDFILSQVLLYVSLHLFYFNDRIKID